MPSSREHSTGSWRYCRGREWYSVAADYWKRVFSLHSQAQDKWTNGNGMDTAMVVSALGTNLNTLAQCRCHFPCNVNAVQEANEAHLKPSALFAIVTYIKYCYSFIVASQTVFIWLHVSKVCFDQFRTNDSANCSLWMCESVYISTLISP